MCCGLSNGRFSTQITVNVGELQALSRFRRRVSEIIYLKQALCASLCPKSVLTALQGLISQLPVRPFLSLQAIQARSITPVYRIVSQGNRLPNRLVR